MRRRAAALALLIMTGLLADATVSRAAPASVYLEDLTWTELRDAIAAGSSIAIVPIGGTEQSGPAIALGKHNVRVKILAGRIAQTLGNALVAPVIAYVPEGSITPPSGHMRFAGTLSISDATFEAVLESTARSLRQGGFTTIVFIGDHGGYQQDEAAVARKLDAEWKASPARVFADLGYYDVTQTAYVQSLLAAGLTNAEVGTHAGAADASLMLATDPSLVRSDKLDSPDASSAALGVAGDPKRASGTLGEVGVEFIVATAVNDIRSFVAAQQGKK